MKKDKADTRPTEPAYYYRLARAAKPYGQLYVVERVCVRDGALDGPPQRVSEPDVLALTESKLRGLVHKAGR